MYKNQYISELPINEVKEYFDELRCNTPWTAEQFADFEMCKERLVIYACKTLEQILEDGDSMPEHMDLNFKGARLDFHCKSVSDCIPIPEDATNGDAIKAMFPNMEITRIQANCVVIQIYEPFYINCAFNLNWWNAKYKGVEHGSIN